MKIRLLGCAIACTVLSIGATPVRANQPIGHVFNIDGKKCTFKQKTVKEIYLHSLPGNTATLIFDDPNCMSAEGVAYDVNVMMINNFIVKPYSHSDSAFRTRVHEMRNSSMGQKRGKCIQSGKYSGIGVVVEYQTKGGSIVSVKHALAIQGCE